MAGEEEPARGLYRLQIPTEFLSFLWLFASWKTEDKMMIYYFKQLRSRRASGLVSPQEPAGWVAMASHCDVRLLGVLAAQTCVWSEWLWSASIIDSDDQRNCWMCPAWTRDASGLRTTVSRRLLLPGLHLHPPPTRPLSIIQSWLFPSLWSHLVLSQAGCCFQTSQDSSRSWQKINSFMFSCFMFWAGTCSPAEGSS